MTLNFRFVVAGKISGDIINAAATRSDHNRSFGLEFYLLNPFFSYQYFLKELLIKYMQIYEKKYKKQIFLKLIFNNHI